MDIFQSAILGVVEGLTEFVPVSSTFHLILTSTILGLDNSDYLKMFEVVIQLGAVSALLFLYTKTLLSNRRLILILLCSFIPTAIIGKFLYPTIKSLFFTNTILQISAMVIVGILFLIVEKLISSGKIRPTRPISSLSYFQAILIGLAQATSIIPGVSRSGSIILSALALGFTRSHAAEYAFLLSIPTILAASLLDLYENRIMLMSTGFSSITPLMVGFFSAFITAYFVVKWFIHYISKHTLTPFAYYRFVLAIILILFRVGLSH